MKRLHLTSLPIAPDAFEDWPGDRSTPMYWVARREFTLDFVPAHADVLVAADRHYELYVNGCPAARQRGFFNGDVYLYGQRWDLEAGELMRRGRNTIEVVVRSDPWRNKNYRCFRPFLTMEGSISGEGRSHSIATDASWETAVIEGWREQIGLGVNRTIHFERVRVPESSRAVLSGFSRDAPQFRPAVKLNQDLPAVYLWDDPALRVDVHEPAAILESGTCEWPKQAWVFDVGPPAPRSDTVLKTLELVFDTDGVTSLHLATSALCTAKLELNDALICERDDTPGIHQMPLTSPLAPACRAQTQAGANTLRVRLYGWADREFRLAAWGPPSMQERFHARCNAEPVQPRITEPCLADRISAKSVEDSDGLIAGDGALEWTPRPQQKACALIDFGKVITGRLELRVTSAAPGTLYLAYGLDRSGHAADCARMGMNAVDELSTPAGESCYRAFDVRTFRYLDVVLAGQSQPVKISGIRVHESVFLDERLAAVETPDALLNEIWKAAVRTAQLCGNELYMDNPEREHAQWADPTVAISAVGYYAFGEHAAAKSRKVLNELLRTQQPDGQLAGYAPGAWFPRVPLQCHMALVALACHRHFMHTGDNVFAGNALDAILRMVAHWENHRTRDGLIADLHTVFVDWGSHKYSYGRDAKGATGALTSMNCYYLGVLRRATDMAGQLGRQGDAAHLRSIGDAVRSAIRAQLFDQEIGAFRDGAGDPEAERNVSQTANALAVQFGAVPVGLGESILRKVFDPPEGFGVIPANALFFPMMAGPALFEHGCEDLAMGIMRRGYGAMLARGPGTLWETWEPSSSLCQGTGAGPAYLLARYLGGVYPAQAGFTVIGVDPRPGNVRQFNGEFAGPFGRFSVRWRREDDGFECRLCVPPVLRTCRFEAPARVRLLVDEGQHDFRTR